MKNNCGYDVFDFDGTGMLKIEKIDESDKFSCDEEAVKQAIKDGIKIIPVEDLPKNFDKRYLGWIDNPENRARIKKYCEKGSVNLEKNKIKSFCIGKYDGTVVIVDTEEEFFQYIKEYIEEAEEKGQEHFDITIDETEC